MVSTSIAARRINANRETTFPGTESMPVRNALSVIFFVVGSSAAVAEESCGMHAVSLLAGGKTEELASLFSNQSEVVEPLQRMVESLGKVTSIQEVATARFAQFKRISIQTKDLPTSYKSQVYWINARSETLGVLQFHIDRAPESTCKLLALHMDVAL
jgi:hypothetical protein